MVQGPELGGRARFLPPMSLLYVQPHTQLTLSPHAAEPWYPDPSLIGSHHETFVMVSSDSHDQSPAFPGLASFLRNERPEGLVTE